MSRPTIVILGAAGLIGGALRRRLIGHYRLVSLDRRPMQPLEDAPAWRGGVEERIDQVDLGDREAVDAWWSSLDERHADIVGVINLAAHYDFANRKSPEYRRLHEGLVRVVEHVGRDLGREAVLVQASSLSTLAPGRPGQVATIDGPPADTPWRYVAWKRAFDDHLDEADIGPTVIRLVLGAVYSDDGELVPLYEHIERVRRGGLAARVFPGDPSHGLTYLHVQDAAEAFAAAVERGGGRAERLVVAIGQPEPVAYGEIQERASLMFRARELPIWRIPRWLAVVGAFLGLLVGWLVRRPPFIRPWMVGQADLHYQLDPTPARRALGWTPQRSMAFDIDVLLMLARQDPGRWHRTNRARPR